MTDWAAIQTGAYSTASKKARALSDTIINSRLSRRELETVGFIIQLEIMKRKAQKESKKIIHLEEYQAQGQGPGSAAAPPEGQGPGSAAAPPEGASNEGRQ